MKSITNMKSINSIKNNKLKNLINNIKFNESTIKLAYLQK